MAKKSQSTPTKAASSPAKIPESRVSQEVSLSRKSTPTKAAKASTTPQPVALKNKGKESEKAAQIPLSLASPSNTKKSNRKKVPVELLGASSSGESTKINKGAVVTNGNNGTTYCSSSPPLVAGHVGNLETPTPSTSALLSLAPKLPQTATVVTELPDEGTFRLAAATPIPISPTVESQFYESQLLLYVLERVRGDHSKRQNYHRELDQDSTELRRSFVDNLAYICDFKKGGTTVTALALQKTPQGIIFWLAANETVKVKVRIFLRQVLQLVGTVPSKVENGASRNPAEAQLMALIIPFNKERLDYYWSAFVKNLKICTRRLEELEASTNGRSQRDIKHLRIFLTGLPNVSKEQMNLVKECYEARKSLIFETLAQLTADGRAYCTFFNDIRHLLGRPGEHWKSARTIVSAALRFPGLFDSFEIKWCASPPSRCYFQSSNSVTLDGMASRIFTKPDEIMHYQSSLDTLEKTSNGNLQRGLQDECRFKTRVHAELLLVDLFYWKQFEFPYDDPYIGCSKPACFNCYQYILAHPGTFVVPACHNKLYLTWRSPDILVEGVPIDIAGKIRGSITSKMNSAIRGELRRQIDGRCSKRSPQYDSVTGTSSSIQDGLLEFRDHSVISVFPARVDPKSSSSDVRDNTSEEAVEDSDNPDDTDDDLVWYRSRIRSSSICTTNMLHTNMVLSRSSS